MRRNSPAPEPMTFVVHRHNGALSPALYHGDLKIGCKDEIVFERRLDTLPNGTLMRLRPHAELLAELWARYQALHSLGALP